MFNKLFPQVQPKPNSSQAQPSADQDLDEFQFVAPHLTAEELSHECADSLLSVEENLRVLKEIAVAVIENPKHRESVLTVAIDGAAIHTTLLHAIKNRYPQKKATDVMATAQQWISASTNYISKLVS